MVSFGSTLSLNNAVSCAAVCSEGMGARPRPGAAWLNGVPHRLNRIFRRASKRRIISGVGHLIELSSRRLDSIHLGTKANILAAREVCASTTAMPLAAQILSFKGSHAA